MEYNEIEGNLITLAKEGKFDVIAHGCNCFCTMKRGVAPQIAEAFGCDKFHKEFKAFSGDINKLGTIDYKKFAYELHSDELWLWDKILDLAPNKNPLWVVNCYTQYHWSTKTKPFDYEAFTLCMRKMNHIFKGKHIGMPKIGSHLAGGNWELIKEIIKKELKDCKVTIVIYKEI